MGWVSTTWAGTFPSTSSQRGHQLSPADHPRRTDHPKELSTSRGILSDGSRGREFSTSFHLQPHPTSPHPSPGLPVALSQGGVGEPDKRQHHRDGCVEHACFVTWRRPSQPALLSLPVFSSSSLVSP